MGKNQKQKKLDFDFSYFEELKNSSTELDQLVNEVGEILRKHRLSDVYLTYLTIKYKSLKIASEKKYKIFGKTGGPREIEGINDFCREYFQGEPLFTNENDKIIPTPLGNIFVNEIEQALTQYCKSIHKIKTHYGRVITIAATQFMMDLVCKVYPSWKSSIKESKILLKLVRTSELEKVLLNRTADLAFGAIISDIDNPTDISPELEFVRWKTEGVVILTNKRNTIVRTKEDFTKFISNGRFILPKSGIMNNFAKSMIKKFPILKQNIERDIDDIFFGMSVLQYNIIEKGFMFVLEGAADWTRSIWENSEKEERKRKLNFIKFNNEYNTSKIHIGLFRRKEDTTLSLEHPLQKCWILFRDMVDKK